MTPEANVAQLTDREGREVVLLVRIWENKILRDHRELVGHLGAVLATVRAPDHVNLTQRRTASGCIDAR